MNQRDTRRSNTFRPSRRDFRKMNCTEILSSPSDGQKNIVNIWSRSWQLISHLQLRGERYENNYTPGVNGQRPKKGADYPQLVNNFLVLRRQVENLNLYIPKHSRFRQRPIEERERLDQQWKRWGWISWSQSCPSSPTWWALQEWQE